MITQAQQAARPLPPTGQPDLRSQQEKASRLEYLRSQVANELKDDDLIDGIVASNASVYHRLQMLLGIRAHRGYCALLKGKHCKITGNYQLLFAISFFVPELATAVDSSSYEIRMEALKEHLRHRHESQIRWLLRKLFTGELKRDKKSTTQEIYVRSTCAGCLRQVSVCFKQGPIRVCKHCLPFWFATSKLYMSQQEVDQVWLSFSVGHVHSCIVDRSFTTAAIPTTYHTDKIQRLAPHIHQASLEALQAGQLDRSQLAVNYIQSILADPAGMTDRQKVYFRYEMAGLYRDTGALDIFNLAAVGSDDLEQARAWRFQQHLTTRTLHELVSDSATFLRQSVFGAKQVRDALDLFEQSVSGKRFCLDLIVEAIEGSGGISHPDSIEYVTSVIKHGMEAGVKAEAILLYAHDEVITQVMESLSRIITNTTTRPGMSGSHFCPLRSRSSTHQSWIPSCVRPLTISLP